MAKRSTGTYVFCLIAASRRPRLTRVAAGLAGMGTARLLDIQPGQWLAVDDGPLSRYGEQAINSRLADLGWVARAAVAHEAVVESFINAEAVLPMKLFTIFTSDERAIEYVGRQRGHIDAVLKRVSNHHEWGVRVAFNRAKAAGPKIAARPARQEGASGRGYLARKKATRDATAELAEHARQTVAGLYHRLTVQAGLSKRRTGSELPVEGGPLLLDAAFLVPSARSVQFRALAAREARQLEPQGYRITVSGPWPPYSFVQD